MSQASDQREIALHVNGRALSAIAEPRLTLADFLRHKLGLHGTHLGCEHGVCGACTVLMDGAAVRSCLLFAVQAEGRRIETIEGLETAQGLHPLQAAFSDNHGLQCGFCTPGMIMTLVDYLRDEPNPSDTELREAISGNLCRCTGYQNIISAAREAARVMRGEPTREST